jgi:transcriptional regulator with XRE-family HTH domain
MNADELAGAGIAPAKFALLLRELRQSRGMSLRDLANAIHFNRSYISNVEAGKKLPEEIFVRLADQELHANGKLLSCWRAADEERRSLSTIRRTLLTANQESDFLAALDADEIDSQPVSGTIEQLAISYLNTPPAPMLTQAVQLRSVIVRTLKSHERPKALEAEYLLQQVAFRVCSHMPRSISAIHVMPSYMPQRHFSARIVFTIVSLEHGRAEPKP